MRITRKSPKMRRIEEKYGKEFWTVVEDIASAGASMNLAASILGYTSGNFSSLTNRQDKKNLFAKSNPKTQAIETRKAIQKLKKMGFEIGDEAVKVDNAEYSASYRHRAKVNDADVECSVLRAIPKLKGATALSISDVTGEFLDDTAKAIERLLYRRKIETTTAGYLRLTQQ